ncbi:hypothetical protein BRAS3843_2490016 [Bradyrhizobium sp. STM 3843]|nr:hypothetical protein BRAS3843_2490016 [Bradyrhizobium sp. STM 3843]
MPEPCHRGNRVLTAQAHFDSVTSRSISVERPDATIQMAAFLTEMSDETHRIAVDDGHRALPLGHGARR